MAIPLCSSPVHIRWKDLTPGMTIHLKGASHCRAFVITSNLHVDPITGHEGWQVMEVGELPLVDGAQPPFTGVVLNLDRHSITQWHEPS